MAGCPSGPGALSASAEWSAIKWRAIERQVRRQQARIAEAEKEGRAGKVKALQRILTRSYSSKLWAVRRVVANKGRRTPGVDGVLWKTPEERLQAARSMRTTGYRPRPLRRIYIPKKNGKLRPLSIPTMMERAMQALYLLALNPVAEVRADPNSYGFRPYRSTADALGQCFIVFAKKCSPRVVFDADIRSCFDRRDREGQWLHEPLRPFPGQQRAHPPTRQGAGDGHGVRPGVSRLLQAAEEVAYHGRRRRPYGHV